MPPPPIELLEPRTLDEAARLLAEHGAGARVLAGGTDLLVDLRSGRAHAERLISLHRVPEGREIRYDNDGTLRIGALTTVAQLAACDVLRGPHAVLREAACQMASPQVRNLATVGGNLASAVPCADLPPVLLVLGASVEIFSPGGRRAVALDAFFLGPRQTALRAGEILETICVPPPPQRCGASYARFGLREGNAIPVVAVAAALALDPTGRIAEARIALGAVAPVPKLVPQAAAKLAGTTGDDTGISQAAAIARDAAEPISDVRGSADFRRELTQTLCVRALRQALARAKETTR